MGKRISAAEHENRAMALHEASEHLLMDWTDDINEYKAGEVISARLARMASIEFAKANQPTSADVDNKGVG